MTRGKASDSVKKTNDAKVKKAIARSSKTIRAKYKALKVGQSEAEVALEKNLAPIVEPLKTLVQSSSSNDVTADRKPIVQIKRKLESVDGWDPEDFNKPTTRFKASSTPRKKNIRNNRAQTVPSAIEPDHPPEDDDVFLNLETVAETPVDDAEATMRSILESSDGREHAIQYIDENFGPLGREYFTGLIFDTRKQFDTIYGVRFVDGVWQIGDSNVEVDKSDNVIINGVTYKGTPGLFELIFKRIPNDAVYNASDLVKYKNILVATNAHKRGYSFNEQMNGSKGFKWKHVIGKLFEPARSSSAGYGLVPNEMTVTNHPVDFVYWNDPNEVVDRLRLLVHSKAAGHTGHDNEIMAIINEMREEGWIK